MKANTDSKIFTVPFNIRSYEVDSNEQCTLSSVCNFFQETAGIHAHHLNFDISQLKENGHTWVLYKMHVKVNHFPKRWQDVEVVTWPSSGDGIRAFRDYELLDKDKNRLAYANSQWMVLDIKTKRPVRMPKEILTLGQNTPDHVLEPKKSPIPALNEQPIERITAVGNHDLDMNNHANNVTYIDWMTGFLPDEITYSKRCTELEIQYVSEAVKGDLIFQRYQVESDGDQKVIRHTLCKGNQHKVIATGITHWC